MDEKVRTLRRVLKLGGARAVTIPRDWLAEAEYVWLSIEPDGSLRIVKARIE